MQQLTLFSEPISPAPAKVLQFPAPVNPAISQDSTAARDTNIPISNRKNTATVSRVPTDTTLTGPEWVREYYQMPEPLYPGDTVRLPDGRAGILKGFEFQSEKNMPNNFKAIDWNSPDVVLGLRGAEVQMPDGKVESAYSYQLTKIKTGNSRFSTTPTFSDDELPQEPTQDQEDSTVPNIATLLKEGEIAWWRKNSIEVRIEWLATNNTIALVRDMATKQPFNVPPSELEAVSAKPFLTNTTPATTEPQPENQKTSPVTSPTANTTGKILTFTISTQRAAQMGVPDPLLTGKKTCTRRLVTGWTATTVSWYQRAFDEGLNIQAWTAIPIAPDSYKLADIRLTKAIYQEALKDMPDEDLDAEGGLWATKKEFIETVCKDKSDPSMKVWVVRFEVVNICV